MLPERDPAVQADLRQLAWDRWAEKQERCACCGDPVVTELYLDLEPFGLKGIACERCRDRNSHWVEVDDDSFF